MSRLSVFVEPGRLGGILPDPGGWRPGPPASDRGRWEALPDDTRTRLAERAAKAAAQPWPELPLTLYLGCTRSGDRGRFERRYHTRRAILIDLVLGECVAGDGRHADAIADAVWSISEESSWAVPAHLYDWGVFSGLPDPHKPIVDLFTGETVSLLAWTDHLLGALLDEIHPGIRPRIRAEVHDRMLTPCLERDYWWMRAHNNWNPWITSNWLTAILLLDDDRDRRAAGIAKALTCLKLFLDGYPADGGCDEGPVYWGRAAGSVLDCLEVLDEATGGAIDLFDDPLIAEMARYVMRAHIDGRWVVNFADASAKAVPPAGLVRRFGRRLNDPQMLAFAAYLERLEDPDRLTALHSIHRRLIDLFSPADDTPPAAPHLRDVWLPDTQFMAARSDGGLFVAAKGGHNDESHNHNDVGTFVVWLGTHPVAIDAGVGTYTRQTFSADRYGLWYMRSEFHNLPVIDGTGQSPGPSFAASDVRHSADSSRAVLRLDIAGAWAQEAGLRRWTRTIELDRMAEGVSIVDDYELDHDPEAITLVLMTVCEVDASATSPVLTTARGDAVEVTVEPGTSCVVSEIALGDDNLSATWGPSMRRLLFSYTKPGRSGLLHMRLAPRTGR